MARDETLRRCVSCLRSIILFQLWLDSWKKLNYWSSLLLLLLLPVDDMKMGWVDAEMLVYEIDIHIDALKMSIDHHYYLLRIRKWGKWLYTWHISHALIIIVKLSLELYRHPWKPTIAFSLVILYFLLLTMHNLC